MRLDWRFVVVAALAVAALAVGALVITGGALAGEKCSLSASKAAKDGKCCSELQAAYKTRGWLGIEKELNEDGTFTVAAVVPGSPAEKAGLEAGDVIEAIDGKKLTAENGARVCSLKAAKAKIGDKVTYDVRRGEERLSVTAELERIPGTVLAEMIEKHKAEHKEEARN